MEKYYVSGCKDNDSETVTCDDSEAQFWTLYVRDDAGLSQGVIDCVFREDAEAAMAAYVECDALQEQVRALAAENVVIKSSVPNLKDIEFDNENMDDASLGEDIGFNDAVELMKNRLSQTPSADAVLREVGAKELDVIADELAALDTVGSTSAIAYVIRQKAARIRAGDQP